MANAATLFDELRDLRVRRPFVPFTVVTASGERRWISEQLCFALGEAHTVLMPDGRRTTVSLRWDQIERNERNAVPEPTVSAWATMEGDYLL